MILYDPTSRALIDEGRGHIYRRHTCLIYHSRHISSHYAGETYGIPYQFLRRHWEESEWTNDGRRLPLGFGSTPIYRFSHTEAEAQQEEE